MSEKQHVIGIDGGATKTLCALATPAGEVLGVGAAGSANFQATGVKSAQHELRLSVERAAAQAGVPVESIATAYYALAGADREKDFATIRDFLAPVNPAPTWFLENDTHAAVRGGTPDGIGIGLIAGTGTNAIGFNGKGERLRVGGMGSLLSDFGSGDDLGRAAIGAAQCGHDGRGEPTALYDAICTELGLEHLEDVAEFFFYDHPRPLDIGRLAPLVFRVANEGDAVAIGILERAGHAIGRATLVIRTRLFEADEEVTVAFGGSILQKGENTRIIDTIIADVRARFPKTAFVRMDVDPVIGAVLLALDRRHGEARDDLRDAVTESYARITPNRGDG